MSSTLFRKSHFAKVISTTTLLGLALPSFAASFQIQEQAASGLGTAYAGTAASAENASTSFYNPAGLTELKHDQVAISAVGIRASVDLDISAYRNTAGTAQGTGTAKPEGKAIVPGFFMATKLTDKAAAGFHVTAPYGLKSAYDNASPARYMATHSELRTIDVGPSVAYQYNDYLSLGAGLGGRYVKAFLHANANVGGAEGFQRNFGRGWGRVWHLGALAKTPQGTRLGLEYRSKTTVDASGRSETIVPGLVNNLTINNLTTTVSLPESVIFSVHQDFGDKWAVMTDVHWTHWSTFKELRLKFFNQATGAAVGGTVQEHQYKNTFRLALGTKYQYNSQWAIKAGVAFDQSPTREEHRTVRIPDSNRQWLAVGLQYQPIPSATIDLGYSHLLFNNAKLNESAPTRIAPSPQGNQSLSGKFKTKADIVGIQLTWNFV